MDKSQRRSMLLMALTILIDFTGFGLILPLQPFWAQRLGANAVGVGLIITAYSLAQFIFTPVLGSLSDRYGRKPVIFLSLIIETISLAMTALAWNMPVLLAARFISGLGASNIGSAQAVVTDVTTPEQRAKGMGMIGAMIGLGFVIGPALGGAISPLGASLPFWVAAAIALINAMLVLLFLPETHHGFVLRYASASRRGLRALVGRAAWGLSLRELVRKRSKALRSPVIIRLIAVNLFFTIAFTAMETIFPLFTQHTFGWTAIQNGYIFTYVGFIVIIMQGGLVGRLVKLWGGQRVMIAGLTMLASGLVLLALSTKLALLLIALGILSAGDGAVSPVVSTLLSFASPTEARGEVLGLAQGVGGLGRIIGPLAAGSIYASAGPGIPFIAGGILVMLAAFISLPTMTAAYKPEERKEHL